MAQGRAASEDAVPESGTAAFHMTRCLGRISAFFVLISIAACSGVQNSAGTGTSIELPGRWDPIASADADLTLAKTLPVDAASFHRRTDVPQQIEDYYSYDGSEGVRGHIVTMRVPGGVLSEDIMLEMRQARLFDALIKGRPEATQYQLKIGTISYFRRDHPHTVGHYATAPSGNSQQQCFFARIGKLLVEDNKDSSYPGAIDTLVNAVLCGNRVDEGSLVAALSTMDVARR
ncbi:hypothetical protein [Pelagibius sp.]|uniref:hypothetical protein n=1 Tax=Pelagibius sp. TaxID=1931238 RepID=UPI003B513331